MNPGQNHHVEVAGALEGVTVADAIRFVSAGKSAPGINYVHAEHEQSRKLSNGEPTEGCCWKSRFYLMIEFSLPLAFGFPGQTDIENSLNQGFIRNASFFSRLS